MVFLSARLPHSSATTACCPGVSTAWVTPGLFLWSQMTREVTSPRDILSCAPIHLPCLVLWPSSSRTPLRSLRCVQEGTWAGENHIPRGVHGQSSHPDLQTLGFLAYYRIQPSSTWSVWARWAILSLSINTRKAEMGALKQQGAALGPGAGTSAGVQSSVVFCMLVAAVAVSFD